MKKCLLIFALPALLSSSLLAQTIPPNEIRPSATSGQVLTTVTGGTPPSWQTPSTPSAGSIFQAQVIPPIAGQQVTLSAASVTATSGNSQNFVASSDVNSASFTRIACGEGTPQPSCDSGAVTSTVTWSGFQLPAGVTPSSVTQIFAFAQAQIVGQNGAGAQINASLGCTTTNNLVNDADRDFPLQPFSVALTAQTGSTIPAITCTAQIQDSSDTIINGLTFNVNSIKIIAYYTGTQVTQPNIVNIAPCLAFNSSSSILSLDEPCDYAQATDTDDAYRVTLQSFSQAVPAVGQGVLFSPPTPNTTTTPTLNLNGTGPFTITKGPGQTALAAGDISGNIAYTIFDGTNWELQNPQTSSGGGGGTVTLTGPVTGSGTGTVATTITPTGVTAGSYTNPNITLNAAGQVLSASNGSGGSGSISVNGASVSNPNLNGTTPAASSGNTNCTWAVSGSSVSCSVPTSSGSGLTALTGDGTASGSGSQPFTAVNLPGHIALTGTPAAGQVPTATSPTAATWQTPTGGSSTGVIHTGVGPPSQGTAATLTHIQDASNVIGGSGTTVPFGSNVTSGDLIVVLQNGEDGMTDTRTPTDTLGTTFQLLGTAASTGTPLIALWGGIAPSSGADTVSWDATGADNPTTAIDEISGALLGIDVSSPPVFDSLSPSTSLTPRIAGDLIIGFGAWGFPGSAVTFTPGSGFILGGNFTGNADSDPLANEYILGGTASPTTVNISVTPGTTEDAAFAGVAIFAQHSGSVGNDGDFYLDSSTGFLYGPRTNGIYLRFASSSSGTGLGVVQVDGTTIINRNGIITAPPGSGPIFNQYTFVADIGSTPAASITSPAITVTASDLLTVECNIGSIVTDSLGNSYSTPAVGSGVGVQISWVISASSGSDAFTCTPPSAEAFQSMVVLDFSATGVTLNTSASTVNTGNGQSFGPFVVSFGPTFTTTQRTLDILCETVSSNADAFSPWMVGPGFGILAGVSASTLGGSAESACEYEIVPNASQSSPSNGMLYGGNTNSNSNVVLAINY